MTGYFSRYSGGLPGAGLLILRAAAGVLAVLKGCAFALGHESEPLWLWLLAAVLCLAGASLILGALTVLTGLTVGLVEVGTACSLLPSPPLISQYFQAAPILVIAMTTAVILIGPGEFSIDARLFGFREVKILLDSPPSDR